MAEAATKTKAAVGLAIYLDAVCSRCGNGKPINDAKTGARVREARLDLGISQEEMGKAMGISAAYLSELENGKRAWDKALLDKAAQVLNQPE